MLTFRNFIRFIPPFKIGLTLGSYLPTLMIFYDSEYYSSISVLKWHQFQVFATLQMDTINGFKWNPAI